jgi:hypothetical protein
MKPEPSIWNEIRALLLRWETLTTELAQEAAGRPPGHLRSLLKERQQICERLDALNEGCGIANWIGETAEDCPAAIRAEIRTIIDRLVLEDERARSQLAERTGNLAQKIEEIRQTRVAGRLYRKQRRTTKGALIDAKR